MFKLLMEFKPDLKIPNSQSLTAFTLAAKLGKADVGVKVIFIRILL